MNRLCSRPFYGLVLFLVIASKPVMSVYLCLAVATVVGTIVAFLVVPMRSLGPDNWKIAASLMGSYIGGCKL